MRAAEQQWDGRLDERGLFRRANWPTSPCAVLYTYIGARREKESASRRL